jgi:hypothetical protein
MASPTSYLQRRLRVDGEVEIEKNSLDCRYYYTAARELAAESSHQPPFMRPCAAVHAASTFGSHSAPPLDLLRNVLK